jgi:hypothetical protein
MCLHYDESAAMGRCREDRADPPSEKDIANFCDWFQPGTDVYDEGGRSAGENARSRLDALFSDSKDTGTRTDPVARRAPAGNEQNQANHVANL